MEQIYVQENIDNINNKIDLLNDIIADYISKGDTGVANKLKEKVDFLNMKKQEWDVLLK